MLKPRHSNTATSAPASRERKGGWLNADLWLWVALLLPIATLVSVPTDVGGQAFLSIVAVLAVAALKPFARMLVPRFFLLATASVIVMRYALWRVFETLPEPGFTLSFICAVTLLAAEAYAVLVFFLSSFITSDPTRRPFPPTVAPERLPTVNVLVPSYNEPTEMLRITLAACKNMVYPAEKLTVVLCDDGGTDQRCNDSDKAKATAARARRAELQALCAELGVMYSTRARNEHAKAGNMSAALARLDGDLVVVFDADHVPTRDFLARTVGYFVEDPKLFLVQTPHFFLNKDPIMRNLELSENVPPENEMFYSFIHRGLDRWDGAFFCGSAAVLRRAALDSVGGFSGETITEDAETALDIHASGWRSMYLNRAMIAGLQPETFASFIQQRGRWATGMMQIMLLKNPMFRRGLTMAQRLCYINSMACWLFPIIRLIFLCAPLAYLFFGAEILVATFQEAMAYMLGYLAVSFLVQNALYSRFRWPLMSEIYEIAQTPYLAQAVIKTLIKPRGAKFNVTAKDETLDNDFISPAHWPLTILWGLCAAGVAALVVRWVNFPGDRSVLSVVGGWAVFNFILVSISWRAVAERKQRRASPRVNMNVPAMAWLPGAPDEKVAAHILDASTSGMRVMLDEPLGDTPIGKRSSGMELVVRPYFEGSPHLEADINLTVICFHQRPDGPQAGSVINADQSVKAQEAVAHLIFGDSENWRNTRYVSQGGIGLIRGLGYAAYLFLNGTPKLIAAFIREPMRRRTVVAKRDPSDQAHILAFGVDIEERERMLARAQDHVAKLQGQAA
ncbi:UDP-forming cellulose synthase catalytic subunit [Pseudoroseicyclus tamaricis]|uniref:Cellulose synthase catalytic subunit [UDP-forming] n=1 Tax=Pseudoroseicyclus tamaricis TaxID=2705421 RepID=A0A6B2JZH4_9RHOB|nr:UDP-forming cellulose synthase catalytic subunit [Pseudoroseicyclus tamaricis]NDV02049.1 UDP-forming cellulose synthase catalytic subunit [Pseudoroseicyclus tamaricis]